ncbi:MAG: PRC-barrel domain-containing protein [Candidatus Hydrogenedentes bacterium]|nr:PRC-barrel domain-containing protein [Candidatus Hydrogenedentota bacterium]
MTARRVEIGSVRSVNPARRELRIRPVVDTVPTDPPPQWLYVLDADGRETQCRIEQAHGDVVMLAAGVTRDAVARMRGATVYADVDATVTASWQDRMAALEGFEVIDEAGNRLGTVAAVYATGANGAIEVAKADGGSLLLPAIERVIASVDMERGRVAVKDIASYKVEDAD